jgi:hypothetical protein
MDTPTDVDRSAPVLAHHEVEIRAPPDIVWRLHIDVNDWPSWQQAITEAHIDGRLEPRNSFDWSSYGFAVTSEIYEVNERRAKRCGAGPPEASQAFTSGFSQRPTVAFE